MAKKKHKCCPKCDAILNKVPKSKNLFFCTSWTCEKFGMATYVHSENQLKYMYYKQKKK